MTPTIEQPHLQELWVSGEGGYHTYRIPALCVTREGTLLAFCEGRKESAHDAAEIDMLLRRSEDGGHTWSETQVVVTQPGMTCGNPAPVVDRDTGVIWLPFNKNEAHCTMGDLRSGAAARTVWLTHSKDDGRTWAEPVEITHAVKRPDWTWYATGPCHSIQLRSGRLLVPCDHRVRGQDTGGGAAASDGRAPALGAAFEPRYSHVIYSDDHGATWRLGGIVTQEGANECAAVETTDGAVYLNCRDQARRGYRIGALSTDGGETFSETWFDETLVEPACQGTVVRLTLAGPRGTPGTPGVHDRSRILFCNPASGARDTLTVRLSYDEGRTWAHGKVLEPGRAAYSDLAVTHSASGNGGAGAAGTVGASNATGAGQTQPAIWCLYERGVDRPYERLTLARFTLEWLTDGHDYIAED